MSVNKRFRLPDTSSAPSAAARDVCFGRDNRELKMNAGSDDAGRAQPSSAIRAFRSSCHASGLPISRRFADACV